VTGYDAGLSHVDEEVHCEVLSAPVFLWCPNRTGVFLSTFKRHVIRSSVLSKTKLKRALLTNQSLSQLCKQLLFVTAFGYLYTVQCVAFNCLSSTVRAGSNPEHQVTEGLDRPSGNPKQAEVTNGKVSGNTDFVW
jgi:hypothetical protein